MRTVNKLRATNKRARLHRRTMDREGRRGGRGGETKQRLAKVKSVAKRERVDKQDKKTEPETLSAVEFVWAHCVEYASFSASTPSSCHAHPVLGRRRALLLCTPLLPVPFRKCSIIWLLQQCRPKNWNTEKDLWSSIRINEDFVLRLLTKLFHGAGAGVG